MRLSRDAENFRFSLDPHPQLSSCLKAVTHEPYIRAVYTGDAKCTRIYGPYTTPVHSAMNNVISALCLLYAFNDDVTSQRAAENAIWFLIGRLDFCTARIYGCSIRTTRIYGQYSQKALQEMLFMYGPYIRAVQQFKRPMGSQIAFSAVCRLVTSSLNVSRVH